MALTSVSSYLLLAGDSAGRIANSLVKTFLFRRHAVGLLENLEALRQLQLVNLFAAHPGLRIGLRVVEGHCDFQGHGVRMANALLQVHPLAMGIAQIVEPRSLVITRGVHYKRVPIPVTHRPAVPAWIGVFRKLPPICPDFSRCMAPFEYLHYFAGSLNELERPAIGPKVSRVAQGIAMTQWIVSQRRFHGAWSARRRMGLELFLPPGRHWRRQYFWSLIQAHRLAHEEAVASAKPHA